MPPVGVEPITVTHCPQCGCGFHHVVGGAESGAAAFGTELQTIIDAWPKLLESARQMLLQTVNDCIKTRHLANFSIADTNEEKNHAGTVAGTDWK